MFGSNEDGDNNMMKSGTTVLIIDSVDKALKFYTEKLAFDIVKLMTEKNDLGEDVIGYAHLRKGKYFLMLRTPHVEELAEFSFIKRCSSRCVEIFAEMKKGIEKYYDKCSKKGVSIVNPLTSEPWGYKTFSIRDPYGLKITFAQKLDNYQKPVTFLNSAINKSNISANNEELLEKMIKHLKEFGILRRAAKKYSKLWIKSQKK